VTERVGVLVSALVLVITASLWTLWLSTGALDPVQVAEREGEALLSLYRVSAWQDDGRVRLDKGNRTAIVAGIDPAILVGEDISVAAVPTTDGAWRATWVELHPGRPAKRWLGLIGLVAAAGLLMFGARLRDGRVWFRG
jgi:hypothetical protein